MKQQVIVIGGGDSFSSIGEFLSSSVSMIFSFRWLRIPGVSVRGWKGNLPEELGNAYEVLRLYMPSPQYAHYTKWKRAFEDFLPCIDENVILVGHSLGGSFLAKYMSEHRLPRAVRATFLVSAPFNRDSGRILAEFDVHNDLTLLRMQGGHIFLYHSKDDPIVDFGELAKFQALLPDATIRTFTDRGHFIGERFAEIVLDIHSLSHPPVDNP